MSVEGNATDAWTSSATLLARHASNDGITPIDGVRACGTQYAVAPVTEQSSGTVLAIVAQGHKRLAWGDRVHDYGAGSTSSPRSTSRSPVTTSTRPPAQPGLGVGLMWEPTAIADLLWQDAGDLPRAWPTA